MTSHNLLELARQGNVEAIATLLNRALQPKGILARVGLRDDCLFISLVGERVPSEKIFTSFIQQAIQRLDIPFITTVQVYGSQTGQTTPAWHREVKLLDLEDRATSQGGDQTGAETVTPAPAPVPPPPLSPIHAEVQGNIQQSLVAVGTNIHQTVYYLLQPDARLGDQVDYAPVANQPQPRLRMLPVLLLPNPFPNLLDRQVELDLAGLTLQTLQPVEVFGTSGIGKTALLRYLAHQSETLATFPNGIVYFAVQSQSPADLLHQLFDAFYECNHPWKPTETQIRHAFQGRRALVLLDDCYLSRDEVEGLINHLPDCTFLLATPGRQLWHQGQAVELGSLPLEDGLTLMERELGRALDPGERSIAEELYLALNGHPLLLLQIASMVRTGQSSLEEILQRMQPALPPERSLLRQILALLPKPQRGLLAVLGAMGGVALTVEQAAAIAEQADAGILLQSLMQQHLVQSVNSRFGLNQVLVEGLAQEWDLSPSLERALSYFTNWAAQHCNAPERLLQESDALLQVMGWAFTTGHWGEVLTLGRILGEALTLGGRWGAWEQVLHWHLQAARSLQDGSAEAWTLHQLGTRALCLDDLSTARDYLTQALRLRESLGDQTAAAVTRHNLNLLVTAPTPAPNPAQAPPPPPPPPIVVPSPPPSPRRSEFWLKLGAGLLVAAIFGVLLGNLLRQSLFPTQPGTGDLDIPVEPSPGETEEPTVVGGLEVSARSVDFGRRRVNSSPVAQTITVTNRGTAPTTLKEIALQGSGAPAFALAPGGCSEGTELAPKATCSIRINFTPRKAARQEAALVITHTAATQPQRVALEGTGTERLEPSLGINIDSIRFEPRRVGTPSELERIVLTSNGAAPLQITGIQLTGDGDDFEQRTTCPLNDRLPPDRRCEINVLFTPQQVGNRTATIVISHNAKDSPQRIVLRGTGIAATAPQIRPSSSSLNFGNVPVGTASKPQSLTLTNTGDAPLAISQIRFSPNRQEFSEENNCLGGPIAPGASCRVQVSFNPGGTGSRSTRLEIVSNARNGLQSIPLSGTGGAPPDSTAPVISNISASPSQVIYDDPASQLVVEADVNDVSGVASAVVRYRFRNQATAGPFRIVPLQSAGGDRYRATLNIGGDSAASQALQGASGTIEYEIEATDKANNRGNSQPRSVPAVPSNRPNPTPDSAPI